MNNVTLSLSRNVVTRFLRRVPVSTKIRIKLLQSHQSRTVRDGGLRVEEILERSLAMTSRPLYGTVLYVQYYAQQQIDHR